MNWLDILNWSEIQTDEMRSIGFSYLQQGKYDLAMVFFEALSVLEADNPQDLQTLGALHLEKGNNLKALEYLDRSLSLKSDASSLLNRVKVLFKLGYKDQAVTEARLLLSSPNTEIALQAQALIMAFSSEKKV
jgi:tetratricopeptide (TPR) repeat protein